MNGYKINKKRVAAFILLLSLIIMFWYFFTNSRVIISTESEEVSVYIRQENNDPVEEFVLTKNAPKSLTLSKGDYIIGASSDGNISSYSIETKPFWSKTEVVVEMMSQKKEAFLGTNDLMCAIGDNNNANFFDCNTKTINFNDGIASFFSLPYKNGFLNIRSNTNELFIKAEKISELNTGENSNKISMDSSSVLSKSDISVHSDSGRISFYDKDNNNLYILNNAKDKDPKKIPIDQNKVDNHVFSFWLHTSNEYTYLINAQGTDHIEDHEAEEEKSASTDPKIIIFDNNNGEIIEENSLPSDWVIRSTVAKNGKIMFILTSDREGEAYIYTVDNELENINVAPNEIQQVCWINSNSFYYSSESGNAIYLHDLEKSGTFLAYRNPNDFIASLNCYNNSFIFAIESNRDGTDGYSFYSLTEKELDGPRISPVLPVFFDTREIGPLQYDLRASLEGDSTINIDLIYNATLDNQPPNKELVANRLKNILAEHNINLESFKINYNF